ncbi:MAG: 30S ribosomal protein S6 [Planctomycetes bacterium]|nr:30S ribosomal protein S6 [Planctomycetota bacterium]MCH7961534.1 30S ribosomal protein S6 [Planctomycetota bacterium]MCH9058136.1 30S ribosomal protein S6 [Planctomycetota bacterium]
MTDTQTLEETRTSTYEAMFLVSQAAATDLAGVIDHINHLFERAGATVLAMSKWDERRLAFEIDKQKRGIFLLTYFTANRDAIGGLERDCNLSEILMRMLVIRADHLTEEEMRATDAREELAVEATLRAEKAAKAVQKDESVSIGAPVAEQKPEPESKSEPEAAKANAPEAPADEKSAPKTPQDNPSGDPPAGDPVA